MESVKENQLKDLLHLSEEEIKQISPSFLKSTKLPYRKYTTTTPCDFLQTKKFQPRQFYKPIYLYE